QTVDVVAVVSSATARVGPAAPREPNVGHTVAEPDADGIVRAVPPSLPFGARPVPAFGLAPVSALTGPAAGDLRMAVDARGRTLVVFAGGAWPRRLQSVPFHPVGPATERGPADRIQTLAND